MKTKNRLVNFSSVVLASGFLMGIASHSSAATEGGTIKLAARRAIDEFKLGGYKQFTDEVKKITKADIPIETNWVELSKQLEGRDDVPATLKDYFDNMFGKTILGAFKSICSDKTGQEALKGAVKKIVIKCDDNAKASENGFSLEKGVLTLNLYYANTDQVENRTKGMIKLLENNL
jgi:hypothetical protein